MKLKKIVSLALAGILAVSMLTACGDKGDSSSEVVPPVVTAGIADALNDARDSYAKDTLKLTYEESSSLTEILKTAAQDKYGKDVTAIKNNAGYTAAKVVSSDDSIYTKVADQLVGTVAHAGQLTTLPKGTNKSLLIYTVGGDYAMAAVGNGVANVATWGTNALTKNMPLIDSGNTVKATYTADVATVKVTSPDDAAKSMWVVAVVYTQTVA